MAKAGVSDAEFVYLEVLRHTIGLFKIMASRDVVTTGAQFGRRSAGPVGGL